MTRPSLRDRRPADLQPIPIRLRIGRSSGSLMDAESDLLLEPDPLARVRRNRDLRLLRRLQRRPLAHPAFLRFPSNPSREPLNDHDRDDPDIFLTIRPAWLNADRKPAGKVPIRIHSWDRHCRLLLHGGRTTPISVP